MIAPERAPVRPRVKRKGGEASFLLEDEIAELAQARTTGLILVRGPAGSGKSTALRHLAAVLLKTDAVQLIDRADDNWNDYGGLAPTVLAEHTLVVATAALADRRPDVELELVPWSQDEWIEYLLACHKDQCKSVMARLLADEQCGSAAYTAEVWRVILDEMAADETVASPLDALICRLSKRFTREQQLSLSPLALDEMRIAQMIPWPEAKRIVPDIDRPSWRLVNQPQVLSWIAAAYAARILKLGLRQEDYRYFVNIFGLPRSFLYNLAALVRGDQEAISNLYRIIHSSAVGCHAAAISVLHLAGALSQPTGSIHSPELRGSLDGAILEGVHWPGIALKRLNLRSVDFSSANLSNADLSSSKAQRADFGQADLSGAILRATSCASATFASANLTGVKAVGADFSNADCRQARFCNADLCETVFSFADLSGASFCSACLAEAVLGSTAIEGVDFTSANLSRANLNGLNLAVAQFRHAIFTDARLVGCVLDGIELPKADCEGANFTNATFTGASMPGANLRDANLHGCGLADVDWEGADLRGADLRGAVFSMGGSRSGLVGSPYPSHGTRTGFYTDDYADLSTHKHPEEIRKANLCGADLRGANIEGVDFYLVDLRGAMYDADQVEQLRRCGAILREPVA